MDLQLPENAFFKEIHSIRTIHLIEKSASTIKLIVLSKTPTIPYGDTLSLEEEIICTSCNNQQSIIRVSSTVIFHKSTIMKGMIKTNCMKESKTSWSKYMEWVANVNNDM